MSPEVTAGVITAIAAIIAAIITVYFTRKDKPDSSTSVQASPTPSTSSKPKGKRATKQTSPIFISKKEAPHPTVRDVEVDLGKHEVIVGQCWELMVLNKLYSGGIAFLIRGPGTYRFSVKDGWWTHYQETSREKGEELLQEQFDSIVTHNNSPSPKLVRLP